MIQKLTQHAIILAGLSLVVMVLMFSLAQLTFSAAVEPTPTAEALGYLPYLAYDFTPTPTVTPTATPTATPSGCVPPPEIPPSDLTNEAAILSGINQQRSSNGLPALALAGELTQSSRRHSLDMAENHFTAHTGSDGSVVDDRMLDACYEWNYRGEIIGWGFGGDAAAMMDWWMNSPVHRATILDLRPGDFGVGYIRLPGSDWTYYWTVNFGRRVSSLAPDMEMPYFCEYTIENELGGSSVRYYSEEPCPEYDLES